MEELSTIERETIKILAERGPMSGYDFHLGGKRRRGSRTALMSSGHWITVLDHLGPEKLNIILKIEMLHFHSDDRRGRRKDLIWLTDKGLLFALYLGANTKFLLANTKKVYPEMPWLHFLIEIKDVIGPKAFDYAFSETLKEEDFSEEALQRMLLASITHGLLKAREISPSSDPIELKTKVDAVVQKYPEISRLQKELKERIRSEMKFFLE